jgi:DNA modification methylase
MQRVPIGTIKNNPNNPRVIKDDKFKKLVQSIKDLPEMAEVRPVVVNTDMVVLGGNMRLKAMREAGWKDVPIQVVDWDEDKQRQFIIKDNVSGGEWDWEMLANEWDTEELQEWGLDLPDFDNGKELEAEEDDYEMPDELQTDIVLGDLFEIGSHRLLCGDSTDSDAVAKLMDGQKADMVFTDPPYALFGNSTGVAVADDKMIRPFFLLIGNSIMRACKPFVHFYSCLDWKSWAAVLETYTKAGLTVKNMIVWDKGNAGLGLAYRSQHELIMFGVVGNVGISITNKKGISREHKITDANIWLIKRENKEGMHAALKPQELIQKAIKNSSFDGDLILDLFLGSGSTIAAAHQLNRKCYGMELDPKYCQVIVDRMLKLDPTLEVKRNGLPYKTEINQ